MLDRLAVNLDAAYTPGMQQLDQFFFYRFQHDQDAGNLNAAACTSGTGTDKHQQDEDGAGKLRPQVKVCCGIAGCCNDGSNLENRLLECLCKAAEISAYIEGDRKRCCSDNQQIGTNFFTFPCLSEFTDQDQKVGVKVDAEQDHKDGHDPLDIGRHAGKTVIAEAEAAGARCTKGGQQSFKHRHPAEQQEHELDDSQAKINAIEDLCRGLHLGHQLIHLRAGAFGFHQVDMGAAGQGQQGEQEHQNAHAADPVGEAAPEQDAPGQVLHSGQDAGTGGGEAGNGLKHGIHRVGNAAREHKGHRAHHTDEQPAERRGGKALRHGSAAGV